jgi:hypothetical protein
MTDVYCPLEEILTMSDLPASYKFRSGPGVSAQPPAKKTTDLIEKETEVSYDLHDIRLRAQGVCMRFILMLFVLILVLVLVLEKRKFVKKLLDTVSRTRTSTTTRTIREGRVRGRRRSPYSVTVCGTSRK